MLSISWYPLLYLPFLLFTDAVIHLSVNNILSKNTHSNPFFCSQSHQQFSWTISKIFLFPTLRFLLSPYFGLRTHISIALILFFFLCVHVSVPWSATQVIVGNISLPIPYMCFVKLCLCSSWMCYTIFLFLAQCFLSNR